MSEAELPELVDEVVVRPGEAHDLPPAPPPSTSR